METIVKIVEVGPRDGLQNEALTLSRFDKTSLITQLVSAGLHNIEVGSFVSPKTVPQMADTAEMMKTLPRHNDVSYSVLVPNLRGIEAAIESRADEVAIFASASETFAQRNTNCSIDDSFERFKPIMEVAQYRVLPVRGYLSCAFGCPYEGYVSISTAIQVAKRLIELGCYEIVISDTIGVGTSLATSELFGAVAAEVGVNRVAAHFHDTRGQALVNIRTCLEQGVRTFDSSVAGLGGCPFAPGASGNVATEDLVYMLEGMGISTGIDLPKLISAGNFISDRLNRCTGSKVAQAANALNHIFAMNPKGKTHE